MISIKLYIFLKKLWIIKIFKKKDEIFYDNKNKNFKNFNILK